MVASTHLRELVARTCSQVAVSAVEDGGHEWLRLQADVGPRASYDAYAFLRHNFDLNLGQLCIAGDRLVMRQQLPLLHISAENVAAAAAGLTAEASRARDYLERR